MLIGFDVSMLAYNGSGVATYTFNLVKNLLLIDKANEYHLFYSSLRRPKNFNSLKELEKLGAHIHSYRLPPFLLKIIWGKFHLIPIEWFTGKMDLFHTSDFLRPPLLPGTKGLTTIHDLTWKLFPQWHTPQIVQDHERKLQKTLKFHDKVLCPSQCTKSDLLRLYPPFNQLDIGVIYEGVEKKYYQQQNLKKQKQIIKKYQLIQPFILYLGSIEPRKNLNRLIKAFSQLIKERGLHQYNLVIGGKAGLKSQEVFNLTKKLHLTKKVIFTGFVDDTDLPALYQTADCFCYVSLYEGFGLPPLEAQASGCPLVASNISSVPEIIGNAGSYVNPYSINSIQQGIKRALLFKDILKPLGRSNSQKFSWEKTAKQFLKEFIS
jgi:glycosyltransferase involved in cell wall biosynthesis